jgi:hypothetical protein
MVENLPDNTVNMGITLAASSATSHGNKSARAPPAVAFSAPSHGDKPAPTDLEVSPPPPLPDTASKGITLAGLRKLFAFTRKLFDAGKFASTLLVHDDPAHPWELPAVDKFEDLTTTQLVYK